MNLKKLIDLERQALSSLEDIPPHEQDDPSMTVDPHSILAGAVPSTYTGIVTAPSISSGVVQTPVGWPSISGIRPNSTIIEGARPEITTEDGVVIMTMENGREMIFQSAGHPIHINGNQRRFRLTPEQAKDLAIQLMRAATEEQ